MDFSLKSVQKIIVVIAFYYKSYKVNTSHYSCMCTMHKVLKWWQIMYDILQSNRIFFQWNMYYPFLPSWLFRLNYQHFREAKERSDYAWLRFWAAVRNLQRRPFYDWKLLKASSSTVESYTVNMKRQLLGE